MAKSTKVVRRSENAREKQAARQSPRCQEVSDRGIVTGADFAAFMSALMSDVIDGTIAPGTANAAVNAGGKMLKCCELQMKFGAQTRSGKRVLHLAAPVVSREE